MAAPNVPLGAEPTALAAALTTALDARTRDAFTAMLTDDVRWGGERHGGDHECTNRDQAGDHYAGLLAAGVTLRITDLQPADGDVDLSAGIDHTAVRLFRARLAVRSPDPDDYPPHTDVRLTLRDGLIADICVLDRPSSIEVLYFDGCPNHETFLPHLRDLLDEHGITTPITLIRIEDDDDARAHRFLGSPTVRVDGHDVEPAERDSQHEDDPERRYAMQCRLYVTTDGGGRTTGSPADEWIIDALTADPVHQSR